MQANIVWTKKHEHVQTHFTVWILHKYAFSYSVLGVLGVCADDLQGCFRDTVTKNKALLRPKSPTTVNLGRIIFTFLFVVLQGRDTVCKTRVVSAMWNWKLHYRFRKDDLQEERQHIFHLKTSFTQ